MNKIATFFLTLTLCAVQVLHPTVYGAEHSPNPSWLEHSYPVIDFDEDSILVSDFSVTGDGKIDDTSALQAALKFCSENDRQCVLDSDMQVRITAPVYIWGGGSLIGRSGAAIKIDITDFKNRFIVNLGISDKHKPEREFSGQISNINFVTVTGPILKGVKNTLPYAVGGRIVKIWRIKDALISGNFFEVGKYMYAAVGSGKNKNWLHGSLSENNGVTIRNNTISATAPPHGMEGIGLGTFRNATISNNTVYGVGDDPIGIHNCENIEIHSNRLASVDGRILITNSENISVRKNYVARHKSLLDNKVSRGMALVHVGYTKGRYRSKSSNIDLSNNHFYYPGQGKDRHAMVYVQGTSDITIANNTFENHSANSIPSVKIGTRIFKKRHPEAPKSQENIFLVGNTTIMDLSLIHI